MFPFTLLSILSLILALCFKSTQATSIYAGSYYQLDLKHTNDLTTTTLYIYVESNIVLGIYNSPIDFNANTNSILPVGNYQNNDNSFVYLTLIEFYSISPSGISFTFAGVSANLYAAPVTSSNPVSSLILRNTNGLNVQVTATVTMIPPQFYTIQTPVTTTIFISTIFKRIIGVYSSTYVTAIGAVYQVTSLNQLLAPQTYQGNDNRFDYTVGAPNYGLTYGGFSFTDNTIKTNYFYNNGSHIDISSQAVADVQTTLTVTPFLTQYYMFTIVTSISTRVLYLYVVNNAVITGAYASLSDIRALTNNILLPVDAFGNNKNFNIFNYTAGTPFYGIDSNGIGVFLDGVKTRLYSLLVVTPSLFLSFDFDGTTYNIPATVTAVPISPTDAPTSVPTAIPTATPTATPTAKPTATPTRVPTRQPTRAPTRAPTHSPTHIPTKTPTATPTA